MEKVGNRYFQLYLNNNLYAPKINGVTCDGRFSNIFSVPASTGVVVGDGKSAMIIARENSDGSMYDIIGQRVIKYYNPEDVRSLKNAGALSYYKCQEISSSMLFYELNKMMSDPNAISRYRDCMDLMEYFCEDNLNASDSKFGIDTFCADSSEYVKKFEAFVRRKMLVNSTVVQTISCE